MTLKSRYYECNHCHTKYKLSTYLEKENDLGLKTNTFLKDKSIIYFMLILIMGMIVYYLFFMGSISTKVLKVPTSSLPIVINNTNARIGSQSIIVNNYRLTKDELLDKKIDMNYWNILFNNGKLSKIESLFVTKFDTYLVAGDGGVGVVRLMELDRNGKEIWSKGFSTNVGNERMRTIMTDSNYILSYKGYKGFNKTIGLNSKKEIFFKLPMFFYAMLSTSKGFMGVTNREIYHIDKKGKVIWKKSLGREPRGVIYHRLVKLQDNNFVEMGSSKDNILWMTKYDIEGNVLWQHKTSIYQFYLEDVVPTSDGGFIVSAGRNIKIHKYNSDGKLEWSSKIQKYQKSFVRGIIESKDGYFVTASVGLSVVITKLDYQGNILWDKKYSGRKRIRAKGIVKAHDGGYLLSINTELGKPWLCKMNEKGKIVNNFDEENYQENSNTHLNYKNKISPLDKILTNLTTIGGFNVKIQVSKDEKYIYAIGQAGGFYIINIENKEKPFIMSNFSKSKTKFGRYLNGAFGPLDTSVYDLKGDYAYNNPFDFVLSKDKKKAYIVDFIHGLYVLDIEDKKNPKLLKAFKEIKAVSIDISSDGEQLSIPLLDMKKGLIKLIVLNTKKLNSYQMYQALKVEKDYQSETYLVEYFLANPIKIKFLPNTKKVFISYKNKLVKYDLLEERVIAELQTSSNITNITLSQRSNLVYISLQNGIGLYDRESMKYINHIDLDFNSMRFTTLSENESKLYTSTSSEGTIKLDISDMNNPKKMIGHKVMGHNAGAVDAIVSKDKKYLYLSVGESLAIVKL